MSRKKILRMVWAAVIVWAVALIQIVTTKCYVKKIDMTQAFARNRLVIEKEETENNAAYDTRNTEENNACVQAYKAGKLSNSEMEKTAESLFRTMGGATVMNHRESGENGYYIAYGYTNGLDTCKKINGHKINMNVAIRYDETKGRTCVTMGTPLINNDI